MGIVIKTGNIFNSRAQVIVNPVNCVGVMGAGLAKQFKLRYPEMFKDYQKRCKEGSLKIGLPYLWKSEDRFILNFPTKDHWRSNSNLDEIRKGLLHVKENYKSWKIRSISFPALGCGLGGLEWHDVSQLIFDVFKSEDETLTVFIYQPN
ncbi:MAG: macro domain-containing protein [Oligoflexia bacterium]|nr:macro domain-containing protein [Oligoflexia bacterium]